MEDPTEIYKSAMDALTEKRYESSLADFILLHELPLADGDIFHILRRTYGLLGWVTLGRVFPPALASLSAILASKEAAISAGNASPSLLADVDAIKRNLSHPEFKIH